MYRRAPLATKRCRSRTAWRPRADSPARALVNCGSTARFVLSSVLIGFPFVRASEEKFRTVVYDAPEEKKGRLSSGRTDPSASHATSLVSSFEDESHARQPDHLMNLQTTVGVIR